MRESPKRAPKVVVVSGGKFHAYHLARGAHRAGLLHRFVTTIFDRSETGLPPEKIVEIPAPAYAARLIQRLPFAGSLGWSYFVGDNWFDRAASRYASEADIYHAFNHHALSGIRAARRAGAITVVDRSSAHPVAQHALLREEFARFGLSYPAVNERMCAKHVQEYAEADWIMVPSPFVHRTMVDEGVPAAKLRRLPLGVSTERFCPGAKDDDVFRVLFVGAVSLRKGVPDLLEGFRRAGLRRPSELILVGEPFPEARAFLAKYDGLYRLVPFLPHGQLVRMYQQASVFVLPSIEDGFGMVVYEAAACGLPLIVSQNVGAEVRDGADGFVVPIRDPDVIADRLLRLQDDALRRTMGESARQYVSQFTWERYYSELSRHYREMWGGCAFPHPGGRSEP